MTSTPTLWADLAQYLASDLPDSQGPTKKLDISNPPGKIDQRVFIGGNYALMPVLRLIQSIVIREGQVSILAADFEIPHPQTNQFVHRFLLSCRRAIFEITVDNGHYAEIQSVLGNFNLGIHMLLVYMAEDDLLDA